MYDNDYLEKILGEQYNMSNYFADTYTEPTVNIIGLDREADIKNNFTKETIEASSQAIPEDNKKEVAISTASKNDPTEDGNKISSEDNTMEVVNQPTQKDDSIEVFKENTQEDNSIEVSSGAEETETSAQSMNKKVSKPQETNTLLEKQEESAHFSAVQVNADSETEKTYMQVSNMYPKIYNAIDPIVELVVKNTVNLNQNISEDLIDEMTNKIFYAVRVDSNPEANRTVQVNTVPINSQDTIHASTSPRNNILRDLIKILILNKILNNRPDLPHHHHCPNCKPQPRPPHHRHRPAGNYIPYQDVPFPEDI